MVLWNVVRLWGDYYIRPVPADNSQLAVHTRMSLAARSKCTRASQHAIHTYLSRGYNALVITRVLVMIE